MTTLQYGRLVNVCMLIGALSALTFEPLGNWGWVAGGIGSIAAVAASVGYFKYHRGNPDAANSVVRTKLKDAEEGVLSESKYFNNEAYLKHLADAPTFWPTEKNLFVLQLEKRPNRLDDVEFEFIWNPAGQSVIHLLTKNTKSTKEVELSESSSWFPGVTEYTH